MVVPMPRWPGASAASYTPMFAARKADRSACGGTRPYLPTSSRAPARTATEARDLTRRVAAHAVGDDEERTPVPGVVGGGEDERTRVVLVGVAHRSRLRAKGPRKFRQDAVLGEGPVAGLPRSARFPSRSSASARSGRRAEVARAWPDPASGGAARHRQRGRVLSAHARGTATRAGRSPTEAARVPAGGRRGVGGVRHRGLRRVDRQLEAGPRGVLHRCRPVLDPRSGHRGGPAGPRL